MNLNPSGRFGAPCNKVDHPSTSARPQSGLGGRHGSPVERFEQAEFSRLLAAHNPQGYPVRAFPAEMQAAILEIWTHTHAPVPLIGAHVLNALSLALQAGIQVESPLQRVFPCSLYLLTVVGPGDCLSIDDRFLMKALRDKRDELAEVAQIESSSYADRRQLWEADTRAGHDAPEPLQPVSPHLFFSNQSTAAGIRDGLSRHSPFCGLHIDDAQALAQSGVLRDPVLLNDLWDGITLRAQASGSDVRRVQAPRFTLSLAMTNESFGSLREDLGAEHAHNVGVLPRCLVAFTPPTFSLPPAAHDALSTHATTWLSAALAERLEASWEDLVEGFGPRVVRCAAPAAKAWSDFCREVERLQSVDGPYGSIRGFASRAPEHVLRLAALLGQFQPCQSAEIEHKTMLRALALVGWYLDTYRQVLGRPSV
ncbi:MAG: hypothetical protein RLZZ182_492 [Pseudomonadota bacterium]|jgi:hypothetical protein